MQANYLLCELTGGISAANLAEDLLENNISIKDLSTKKGFAGNIREKFEKLMI